MLSLILFAVFVYLVVRYGIIALHIVMRMHQLHTINYRVFVPVMTVIVGVELAVPSTTLTGLERPAPPPLQRQLDGFGMPDQATMTYQDVADSADWLWRLGMVPRSEVAERLHRDIAIIEDRIAALGEVSDDPLQRLLEKKEREGLILALMLDGFRKALTDLTAQFPAGTILARDVDAYVAETLRSTFNARKEVANARFAAAEVAKREAAAYADGLTDPEAAKADPAYREILAEADEANKEWLAYVHASSYLGRHAFKLGQRPEIWQADYPFPAFSKPIPLIMHDNWLRTDLFTATHSGPPPQDGTTAMMRKIWAAFTGYTRPPAQQQGETRCGLQFVETQAGVKIEYLCETTKFLRANYDLTGAECESSAQTGQDVAALVSYGTHAADGLCKESWIFPTVNMVVTPDSLTIYPPHPTGSQGQAAPLSHWLIEIDGRRHQLPYQITRFTGSMKLPQFTLVHDVKPQVQHPRIWRDFTLDRSSGGIAEAIISDAPSAHDFTPMTFADPFGSELSPLIMDFFALEQPEAVRQQQLATQSGTFLAQRLMIERLAGQLKHDANLSRETRTDPINIDFCPTNWLSNRSVLDTSRADTFKLLAEATQGPTCEAYYAMGELNRQAELAAQEGTWLWLAQIF